MIGDARLQMIKAAAEAQRNREDKMSRMKAEERNAINKRIQEMFKKDGYTDKAVVEALYKEDGIEVSPASICIYRNELGLTKSSIKKSIVEDEDAGAPETPKKRKYTRRTQEVKDEMEASDEDIVTLDTLEEALANIAELLKMYRKQQKERLAALI